VAAEQGLFKGEGGKVWTMDLPLSAEMAKQLANGMLVKVEQEKPKELTPKERLQADAAGLGLAVDGTVKELTDRIDAKVAELLKQAAELDIDADTLSAVELAAAIEAKLAE